ncbi:cytochrome C oxidase subunit II [Gordoniibacillus kamchatkensis]|uniref:Cytochrome C oxidase subunit II n=1 Tax=Gordoniibacillus kamchatkensis TaxID=1590651 RepID=A0ABR5AB04_9BACL|nr:cupredoxin domain-containing protein [Paenibacillus sp. VKM B-2647]KIL37878.1 cytochrome C oxidase subunit II [Paenibacillus sp. VKM B-2647]
MKKLIVILGVIALALGLAACGSNQNSAPSPSAAPDPNAQQVKIEATNWQFNQPEYHVKKGQPVTITFDSKQGMHSATLKDFNVKLDTNNKTATFTPDKAGSFEIRCMIPCGQGHANMVSKLVVD